MASYNVCLSFDIHYANYAKVLIESISRNLTCGHRVDIVVLTGCKVLLEKNGSDFKVYSNISLRFIDVSRELLGFRQVGRFPPQVYARLFMHKYLHESVLYLDVDILVNSCLSKIFLYRHSPSGLSACVEEGVLLMGVRSANFKTKPPYFNAGVLLCDLANCNLHEKFDLAIALAQQHDYSLADQDALNFAFDGQFDILPNTFNDTTSLLTSSSDIIHFAHLKPTRQLFWLWPFYRYCNYVDDLELKFSFKRYGVKEIFKKICFIILSKSLFNIYKFRVLFKRWFF
jgi:lipopolysaccharide biosynthesis glycosyltransferase